MNPNTLKAKQAEVEELKTRLATAKCTIILSYDGINVTNFNSLRIKLRECKVDDKPVKAGVEVRKNTLVRRALEAENDTELEKLLTGSNALITCDDPLAALSVVTEFASKNKKNTKIKGGLVENVFLNEEKMAELGKVGSRNGLYSQLLSVLEAGMRNLALDIKSIAEKKQGEAGEAATPAA